MYYRWALIDSGCSRCRIAVVELNTTVPPLLSVLYATYCIHSTYIINSCNILLRIRDCWRAAAISNTALRSGVTLAIGHLSYCWINVATPLNSWFLFRSNIQICTIIVVNHAVLFTFNKFSINYCKILSTSNYVNASEWVIVFTELLLFRYVFPSYRRLPTFQRFREDSRVM